MNIRDALPNGTGARDDENRIQYLNVHNEYV
jgi:hypothetical protein